jgi:hypothetical protein
MVDSLGAIAAGIVLVLGSMVAGGVIYVVIRDAVKRNIRQRD